MNSARANLFRRDDAATESLHDEALFVVDVSRAEIHGARGVAQTAVNHLTKRCDIKSMDRCEHHAVQVARGR